MFELLTSSDLALQGEGGERVSANVSVAAVKDQVAVSVDGLPSESQGSVSTPGKEAAHPEAAEGPQLTPKGGLVTILFTDLEGSTELLNRLGDAEYQELLHVHNSLIRDLLVRYRGTEVKAMGDGFMIAFTSPREAAECAIEAQRSLADRNAQFPEQPLRVRMGLNAGEVIREEGDFFGNMVVLASRIMDQASGGQILASDPFRKLLEGAEGLRFVDRGWKRLKGFNVRQHFYELMSTP